MPNRDKTGPEGKGEKTGREKGICEDKTRKELSEAADFPADLGLGRGKGLGRKNRRGRGDGKGPVGGRGRRSTD